MRTKTLDLRRMSTQLHAARDWPTRGDENSSLQEKPCQGAAVAAVYVSMFLVSEILINTRELSSINTC